MQTSVLLSILFPPGDATYMMQDRGQTLSQFLLFQKKFITQCFKTLQKNIKKIYSHT